MAVLRGWNSVLWGRLGGCIRCTRTAFRAALIAWGLAACARVVAGAGAIEALIGLAACGATALWLAHVLAHAVKTSGRGSGVQRQPGATSRRDLMPLFVRALVSAAIITSVPRLAFGQCGDAVLARCQSVHTECRSGCDRTFHRDERNHACHQECSSNYDACQAGCG
jgi:hypothetical protein